MNHELTDNKINYFKKDKFIFDKKYDYIKINFNNKQNEYIKNNFDYVKKEFNSNNISINN